MGEATHVQLWKVCRDTYWYHRGLDTDNHQKPDCSWGCKYFHPLEGIRGGDWGVCFHPKSPRAGLLTFEHMGCEYFKYDRKNMLGDRNERRDKRQMRNL